MTKKSRIPKFKSVRDEAEFWDSHDLTDFWDELTPVKVNVSRKLSHILPVRFDDQTLSDLESEASERGVATGTLIRRLVKEQLGRIKQAHA
jgi:hypothetical protein